MPTELRDCAEDSKILERQVTYMPSGQIGERYRRAGSAHSIRGETAPYGFLLRARAGVPLATRGAAVG